MKQPCTLHKYGEPNQQGYVTCSACGHTFNVADDNDDDDYESYIEYADGEDE